MKTCKLCGQTKELSDFNLHPTSKDKRSHRCKICENQYQKEYRSRPGQAQKKAAYGKAYRSRPQYPEQIREYRVRSICKHLHRGARLRARDKGLAFDLDETDIVVPPVCPVLGITLQPGRVTWSDASPTVDRVRPEKGYVKGNVQVISWRANRLKSDATLEDLEKVCAYVRDHHGR